MSPRPTPRPAPPPKVVVVAAVLDREGRFLIGKRSPHKQSAPGYWCPISGRVEPGETQAEAVVREVREETGLRVRARSKVAECDTHDGSAIIHWWRVETLDEAEGLPPVGEKLDEGELDDAVQVD